MNSIKLFFLMAFTFLFLIEAQSQSDEYVIQVATYSSTKKLNENKSAFRPLYQYGMVEKGRASRGSVKVFLRDFNGNFSSMNEAKRVLRSVKRQEGFSTAFIKTADRNATYKAPKVKLVNDEVVLSFALDRSSVIPEDIPEEFDNTVNLTSKGATTSTSSSSGKFRIRLGCFGSKKSNDQLASTYAFSNYEQRNINRYVRHDFMSVDGDVCRRYFFGNYSSEDEAVKRKNAMEKASGEDLDIVVVQ